MKNKQNLESFDVDKMSERIVRYYSSDAILKKLEPLTTQKNFDDSKKALEIVQLATIPFEIKTIWQDIPNNSEVKWYAYQQWDKLGISCLESICEPKDIAKLRDDCPENSQSRWTANNKLETIVLVRIKTLDNPDDLMSFCDLLTEDSFVVDIILRKIAKQFGWIEPENN